MVGECRGPLTDVLELGQLLAREAMDAGDNEWAMKAIERMKEIIYENDLAILEAEL